MKDNFVMERIAKLCKQKNLSYYGLAKKAKIHQCTLSVLINRNSIPNFYTLEKICKGLDMTMADFFNNDEEHVYLSEDKKALLKTWEALSDKERRLLLAYADGLMRKRYS